MDIADVRVGELPVVVRVQRRAVGRTVGAPETRDAVGIAEVLRATQIQHVPYHSSGGAGGVANKARFDQLRASVCSIGSPKASVSVRSSGPRREVKEIFRRCEQRDESRIRSRVNVLHHDGSRDRSVRLPQLVSLVVRRTREVQFIVEQFKAEAASVADKRRRSSRRSVASVQTVAISALWIAIGQEPKPAVVNQEGTRVGHSRYTESLTGREIDKKA